MPRGRTQDRVAQHAMLPQTHSVIERLFLPSRANLTGIVRHGQGGHLVLAYEIDGAPYYARVRIRDGLPMLREVG